MIRTKLFAACALAFVVSFASAPAAAQEPANQITYFTFSAPFELPGGKTLPAGKYVFKIIDSPSNRHIIQVMSEDQRQMHATVMAIPAQRMDPADEPEVRFMEAEANAAPAIRTWWYPGRSIGHEFIYPRAQARRLAARQSEGVLTVTDDAATEEEMRSAQLARIDAAGREAALESDSAAENAQAVRTPTSSPRRETAPEETTARTSPNQPTTSERPTDTRRTGEGPSTARAPRTELPRTGSPLPLFALLGLGSLLGAGALRLRR